MKTYRLASLIVILAMVLVSCTATPTAAPTVPAAEAATATIEASPTPLPATSTPTPSTTLAATAVLNLPTDTPAVVNTATPAATATAAAVATIPADKLVQKNQLNICSDIPYPPQEFVDDNGNVVGLDVEIGNEIGTRLGLKVNWVNSVFDTIIAAVTGGKCDIVISAMNITATRKKQVSMIPYFQAGQALVVLKDNPKGINGPTDLCGQAVAAESGTTNADWLQGTGDYKTGGTGLPSVCAKAGKKAPVVTVTQKDSDAFQQLISGKVVAYATDSPVAGYYTSQHSDQFQVAGQVINPIPEGIVVPCGKDDCTSAPLTEVGTAVQAALSSMIKDGAYAKILAKWNLSGSAIQP